MEPAMLRFAILQLIEAHEAKNDGAYVEDTAIAEQLAVPLKDVQRQLDILENRELVELAKAMGPSYGALLTPNGFEALEAARSEPDSKARKIGF